MKILTDQQIFDKVAKHLLSQMEESKDETSCLYRGPDGLKCAIGCLIPDHLYSEKMEELDVYGLFSDFGDAMEQIGLRNSYETYQLLTSLQIIHDAFSVEQWPSELVGLALRQNLDPSIVDDYFIRS